MFENMFEKALKYEKRLTMVYYQEQMVDRDAFCPIIFTPSMLQILDFGG